MTVRCSLTAVLLALFACGLPGTLSGDDAPANVVTRELLATGTPFETLLIIRESGQPGPVVLMTGGMHGNEPAGAAAALQISEWPLCCGTLICVPRTNPPALEARARYTPDALAAEKNLNRNFVVSEATVTPRGLMAEQLWQLVEQFHPDWVIDLHEGSDFGRINGDSVGSSVIADKTDATRAIAQRMVDAVDAQIDVAERKFMLRGPPIAGSLTRATSSALGIPSMILETTSKDQSLAVRCRQHRTLVDTLLSELGMIESSYIDHFVPSVEADRFNVALYDDGGVAGNGIPALLALWESQPHVTIDRVCGADVRAGVLAQFDLICCSGGSGSAQSRSLAESGRNEVRRFVEDGGRYVGICAGSYLACSGFTWGLGILDAKTKSSLWRRGRATLAIDLTDEGIDFFESEARNYPVLYANGPVIEPHTQDHIPDYSILATFAAEVAENDTPAGVMVHSPAIVQGAYGSGRVVCISPHPEQTPETRALVLRLLERFSSEVPARSTEQAQ